MSKPQYEKPKPPEEPRPKPAVTLFGVVRREKAWHALAVRIRGRDVVEERVLESSEHLDVAEDVVARAAFDWAHHEIDPLKEVPR